MNRLLPTITQTLVFGSTLFAVFPGCHPSVITYLPRNTVSTKSPVQAVDTIRKYISLVIVGIKDSPEPTNLIP